MTLRELGIVCVAAALAGCGGKNDRCVPGASAPCACASGQTGAQTCKADGTYDVCRCEVGNGGTGGGGGSGAGGDMGGASGGAKRVFVTSLTYSATVAPTVCQNVAESANLGGTWVAWLSTRYSNDSIVAIDQVTGTGPWKLLTGETAFANHGQLATTPSVVIDVTEMGTTLDAGQSVWTGTTTGGQPEGSDCDAWGSTATSLYAAVGALDAPANWTNDGLSSCGGTNHVYCFEQ